jgi:hypothetical protein
MCAEGRRPICQDTGIVNLFLKVGMNVRWDATLPSGASKLSTSQCVAQPASRARAATHANAMRQFIVVSSNQVWFDCTAGPLPPAFCDAGRLLDAMHWCAARPGEHTSGSEGATGAGPSPGRAATA